MSFFVVTIKLAKTNSHDPRNKVTAGCPTSAQCTDSTGEHHSFVMVANSVVEINEYMKTRQVHVTRIELVKNTLEMK